MKTSAKRYFFTLIASALLLCACGEKQKDTGTDFKKKTAIPDEENIVEIEVLETKTFDKEIVSNGKAEAAETADLRFRQSGEVEKVYVRNGQSVVRGQAVAALDKRQLQHDLENATRALEKSELDLQDFLIGQGYDPAAIASVPDDMMRLARLRSGYTQSEASYEMAKYNLETAVLRAPIDGVIADLKQTEHSYTVSEPVCRIVNGAVMKIEFPILENELGEVRKGDKVSVTAFADKIFEGTATITAINPIVDANGLVAVTAEMHDNRNLISGMNVQVCIHRTLSQSLVVPKTSVVRRSNRNVVFTVQNGMAYWNYVEIGGENLGEYLITKGLREGDTVIVNGGRNLTHESPVTISSK